MSTITEINITDLYGRKKTCGAMEDEGWSPWFLFSFKGNWKLYSKIDS